MSKSRHSFTTLDGLLSFGLALFVGLLDAGLLLGWDQINPANLAWLRKDPAIYQAGWEFFRRQHLTYPPTWIGNLDYPFGISVAYLDVIPAVVLPLRLFAGLLPENFQYFGLYLAGCLVLQFFFARKLLLCFTPDRVLAVLSALFFLNSPILVFCMLGHFSLCSQWLLLASLYYYFRPLKRVNRLHYLSPFLWLTVLSGAITPYLAMMILAIAIGAVLRTHLERERFRHDHLPASHVSVGADYLHIPTHWTGVFHKAIQTSCALWIVALVGSTVLALFAFGFLSIGAGQQMEAAGYGSFSLNLLSPINPAGPSLYFRSFSMLPAQANEGYAYLGLGIILLGIVCLARAPSSARRLLDPSLRPLLYISALLTLLALSIRVSFGPAILFVVGVPETIFHALAVFRASGRFFWPAYYLLMLGAIVGVCSTIRRRWGQRFLVAVAFAIQFLDTLSVRNTVAEQSRITVSNPLLAKDWSGIALAHKHLVVLPAWQCDSTLTPGGDPAWPWFARLAARNGLTLNSVHAARASFVSSTYNCGILAAQIARGEFRQDTAYVLGERLAEKAILHDVTHYCRRVNGFILCTFDPNRAPVSRRLLGEIARV